MLGIDENVYIEDTVQTLKISLSEDLKSGEITLQYFELQSVKVMDLRFLRHHRDEAAQRRGQYKNNRTLHIYFKNRQFLQNVLICFSYRQGTKCESLFSFPSWRRLTMELLCLQRKTSDTLYRSVAEYPSFRSGY
ncbi:hypothetical protein TNCV_793891 [Trichonephila clavipes]|nr:hypothetical protein TNCV_793891 [Trichonephila clavipes]